MEDASLGNESSINSINTINTRNCLASKNQKDNRYEQCPNKKKHNTLFCGKHKNYTHHGFVRFDHLITVNSNRSTHNYTSDDSTDSDDNYVNAKYYNNIIRQKPETHQPNNEELYYRKAVKVDRNGMVIENTKNIKNLETEIIISLNRQNMKYVNFMDYARNPRLIGIKKHVIDETFNKFQLKIKRKKDSTTEKKRLMIGKVHESYLIGVIHIDKVIKIQRFIKNFIKNKKYLVYGPALFNRKICNNVTDFYNLDEISDIPDQEFFSYKDNDGFVYGFHIDSIIKLIKEKKNTLNPYNRKPIPSKVKNNALKVHSNLKSSSKVTQNPISDDEPINMQARNSIVNVMQKIDLHGYNTNIVWIFNATIYKLRSLYRHLQNYWSYKAGLTNDLKRKIYPPTSENGNGNPFYDSRLFTSATNKYIIMIYITATINRLIDSSEDDSIKNMGCMITLMAISEINNECAQYNPWLIN